MFGSGVGTYMMRHAMVLIGFLEEASWAEAGRATSTTYRGDVVCPSLQIEDLRFRIARNK